MLELDSPYLEAVRRILQTHVPDLAVRAFGSRVCGSPKPYSDLDLVIMTAAPLPMPIKVRLEEAFSESCLPFKVDVLYWDEVAESFREVIRKGWEPVQNAQPISDVSA